MASTHWIDHGDLWKSKAHILQLQLRQRFRVAVDRGCHRHAMFSGDGYLSSTINRWLQRFRNFRRNSLASSSAFYRRRVGKDIYSEEESVMSRMLQAVAVPVLGNICYVFMHGFNRVHVYGAEKLRQALLHRPKDQSLITVSNHVASTDDPLVIASLLPPRVLMDAQNLRWTLCATDRCFKNPATSALFHSLKVLPVSRGDGIYQKGLDLAISKLNGGGWVHIFPEGTRSRDGGRTVSSAKRGIGRLVLDSDHTPIVLPFVHTGMQNIMPIGASFPRIDKSVTVLIGDPIQFDDILDGDNMEITSRGKVYDAVSSRVGERLREMKIEVDRLCLEQSLKTRPLISQNEAATVAILEQLDWELLGLHMVNVEDDLSTEQISQTEHVLNQPPQPTFSDKYFGTGMRSDGGIVSRIRDFVDSNESMGFALKSVLFSRSEINFRRSWEFTSMRAWKQFYGANVQQYNYAMIA